MFEAQVAQGSLWKKVVEATKDLVTEVNIDCTPSGMALQAMDAAHIALVNLLLKGDGFNGYRCERNVILGLNLGSLGKVMRTIDNTDKITLRHEDDTDSITVLSEAPGGAKSSEYQLKLMEIEGEQLVIPEQEYSASVSMPSAEFTKLCKDMSVFNDTVTVTVNHGAVKFQANGDIGGATTVLKATGAAADQVKSEMKQEQKVKSERVDETDEEVQTKKPAPAQAEGSSSDSSIRIQMTEEVSLAFPLRYFSMFAKGGSLSDRVTISMAKDCPCLIEYDINGIGFLRFYLAPKVNEE